MRRNKTEIDCNFINLLNESIYSTVNKEMLIQFICFYFTIELGMFHKLSKK